MEQEFKNTVEGAAHNFQVIVVATQNNIYTLDYNSMQYYVGDKEPQPLTSVSDITRGNNLVLIHEDRCITTSPIKSYVAL